MIPGYPMWHTDEILQEMLNFFSSQFIDLIGEGLFIHNSFLIVLHVFKLLS